MNARRFYLDIREDGEAILTAQPMTRFDPPPSVVHRSGTESGGGSWFVADVVVGKRTFTVNIESEVIEPEKGGGTE